MDNEVYWKLYQDKNSLITIVCMQEFDEMDYDQNKFVRDSLGNIHTFYSKSEAINKLNNCYKSNEIDPKYLKNPNQGIDPFLVRD